MIRTDLSGEDAVTSGVHRSRSPIRQHPRTISAHPIDRQPTHAVRKYSAGQPRAVVATGLRGGGTVYYRVDPVHKGDEPVPDCLRIVVATEIEKPEVIMGAVQDVRAAVGWSAAAAELDWTGIEDAVGIRYPAEFKELCSTFPPGEFQTYLKVLHPSAESGPAAYAAEVSGYAKLLRDDALDRGFPYPIHPAPGGIIPWATIGFDYIIGWLAGADEPDAWPVIVCESHLLEWHLTGLGTGDFMRAITTVPSAVPTLDYVAEECQPPDFTPAEPVAGTVDNRRPRPGYWLEGQPPAEHVQPFNAVAELRSVVVAAPTSPIDWSSVFSRMGRALPGDFRDLIDALGAVSVGPASVIVPDGSGTGFFAELERIGERLAEERAAGGGPIGTIHPETDGLITWGRLRGGGYLCWVPVSYTPKEWPVIVLDEGWRFSAVYPMSASRFLLELAEHPERILLPPAH